jgi:fructose-1,6-bisphosphatase/inositol monophosphatase family enzyme
MHINFAFQRHLFSLSQDIQRIILNVLKEFPVGRLSLPDGDLKGYHYADKRVYESLAEFFRSRRLPAHIYIESGDPIICRNSPLFCIFIDPIDGSLNRDLGVGDPAIVIVYAWGSSPRFRDVFDGYVYGLRSGDTYYSKDGRSYWIPCNKKTAIEIACDSTITELKDTILYYNDGYGQEFAKQAFFKAGILPLLVKHHNAFDNAALEICQICRGAAHLRVEARAYRSRGKLKGSDHANILAAFAIGKAAGLRVTDLAGESLEDVAIDVDAVQDFICACNEELLSETVSVLSENQKRLYSLISSERLG